MKPASLFLLILTILCSLFIGETRAQISGCSVSTPFYTVNLVGSPHGTWTSPSHARNGLCCTATSPDICTSFRVNTDTGSVMLKMEIVSGAIASGALYYQVGCGPLTLMGGLVWLSGHGPFDITFCKPGSNPNVYRISTYSKADTVINGINSLYACKTTTLSIGVPNGKWTSSNTSVATVDTFTGVVTGITAGTANISYAISTVLLKTITVTVNPVPAITGPGNFVCGTSTLSLSDAAPGGTWSSNAITRATVNSSGVVTAVSTGIATISYSLGATAGCYATTNVTVNPTLPPITGTPTVCATSTTTLANTTSGGTWSSSSTGIATIGSSTGVATGVAAGTSNISYNLSGNCRVTKVVTVLALPSAISGPAAVCNGATATLADVTSGGTWSSKNSSIIAVGSATGILTTAAVGKTTISYTLPTGCYTTVMVTVDPTPSITNTAPTVCQSALMTFAASIAGGTWSCSSAAVATITSTGVATGIAAGTAFITYQLPTGCQDTAIFLVNATPSAISGVPELCNGSVTTFGNTLAGGSWNSSNTSVCTIGGTSGVLNGMGVGTAIVSYVMPTGCNASRSITVNPLATLTGKDFMCIHLTTQLTSSIAGGGWSSSRADTASVNTTGLVTGLGQGTALITYTTTKGCVSTKLVRVNNYYYPLETSPISTPLRTNICLTTNLQLNSPLGGDGVWKSTDTTVATVTNFVPGSTVPWGLVKSVSLGTVTISFTASNGCTSTHTLTINPMPVITSAPTTVCRYGYVTLNATPAVGGTSSGQWISHQLTICQVGSYTGVVHASTLGVAEIVYRTFQYDACGAAVLVTVNACTPRMAGGADPDPNGYSIYPNPGTSKFTITQDVVTDQQLRTVVTNCLGQTVFNGNISFVGGEGILEMPTVSPGIYLVQLEGKLVKKVVLRLAVQ